MLLDAVELASSTIETIADGAVNVPGLKSAAGLVRQIVVIAKVSVLPARHHGTNKVDAPCAVRQVESKGLR